MVLLSKKGTIRGATILGLQIHRVRAEWGEGLIRSTPSAADSSNPAARAHSAVAQADAVVGKADPVEVLPTARTPVTSRAGGSAPPTMRP